MGRWVGGRVMRGDLMVGLNGAVGVGVGGGKDYEGMGVG